MFFSRGSFGGLSLNVFLIILQNLILIVGSTATTNIAFGMDCTDLVLYKPHQTIRKLVEVFYEEKEKESFKLQITERRLFPTYHEPLPRRLIIMSGVNSSGKSYLSQEFVNNDPTAIFISMRSVCVEIARDFFMNRKKTEFESVYTVVGNSFFGLLGMDRKNTLMKKILQDVKNREEFLDALTQLEKVFDRGIFQNINKALLQKAMPFLCLGRSVIFDRISYEKDLSIFEEVKPLRVLTYCSLPELIRRAQERSFRALLKKDPNEYRFCLSTCWNFTEFFRHKTKNDRGSDLGNLSRKVFLAQLEEAYTLSVPDLSSDFISQFTSFKQDLLRSMSFHKTKKIKLYSRDEVDLVLDTSSLSPRESFFHLVKSINFIRALPSRMVFPYPLTTKDLSRYINFKD